MMLLIMLFVLFAANVNADNSVGGGFFYVVDLWMCC